MVPAGTAWRPPWPRWTCPTGGCPAAAGSSCGKQPACVMAPSSPSLTPPALYCFVPKIEAAVGSEHAASGGRLLRPCIRWLLTTLFVRLRSPRDGAPKGGARLSWEANAMPSRAGTRTTRALPLQAAQLPGAPGRWAVRRHHRRPPAPAQCAAPPLRVVQPRQPALWRPANRHRWWPTAIGIDAPAPSRRRWPALSPPATGVPPPPSQQQQPPAGSPPRVPPAHRTAPSAPPVQPPAAAASAAPPVPVLQPVPGYEPGLREITDASKLTKSATSALQFEDVRTAVKLLTEALALLTQPPR